MQRKLAVLGLAGLFLVMSLVVAGDSIAPNNPSAIVIASGTCVIRVQYLDGCPRSNADVFVRSPPSYIGRTNESGQVECSLANGGYQIFALYPPGGPQFGTDVFLPVPEGTTMTANYEITPPNITILSPQNQTYTNRSIPLTYTVYDFSPISWTGYSLDGQVNTTITGNTTLTGLSFGIHNVAVYSNDTYGNMGSSETVYFTVQRTGIVTVKVQYLDGAPRSGADVFVKTPLSYLGRTDSNGDAINDWLSPGACTIFALYPPGGPQFGSDAGLIVDDTGYGSATITANCEMTPPIITILSPQNITYANGSVPLTFSVYDYSPIPWIGYSLDGQSNITIAGNITLTVGEGTHSVIVYANDTFGNMGSSETVYFSFSRHDIAVTCVSTCKDSCVPMPTVSRGFTAHVNATVLNLGEYVETFDVTVYANDTVVGTQTVLGLNPGNQTVLTFVWNTSDYTIGNYTISAYATPVFGETEISNNTCIGGTVKVTIVGDLNGDDKVDIKDISLVARAFGTSVDQPGYTPNGDIIDDNKIDIKDVSNAAKHFGEHYP